MLRTNAAGYDKGMLAEVLEPRPVDATQRGVAAEGLDGDGKRRETQVKFEVDEGVRRGTNMEGLAKLRPVFAAGGSVTAGNNKPGAGEAPAE